MKSDTLFSSAANTGAKNVIFTLIKDIADRPLTITKTLRSAFVGAFNKSFERVKNIPSTISSVEKETRVIGEKFDEEIRETLWFVDVEKLVELKCMSKGYLEQEILSDVRMRAIERRKDNKRWYPAKQAMEIIDEITINWGKTSMAANVREQIS